MEFIGDLIKVETEGLVKRPVRFVWRGRTYAITRILAGWHDYSMPTGIRRPRWTMRRHRNYYHVETETGERFELYLDRGAKQPVWILSSRLDAVPGKTTGEG